MSASLVGSEMCIRDRHKHSSQRWCPHDCLGLRRFAETSPVRTSTQGPVSYTHLTLPTICSV
eukprot:7565920-Alexandrium_andersonii.AAC.1